jgi:hypothetical protein
MIEIGAPDGSVVRFPDGTPDTTIKDVMAKAYGGPKAKAPESWGDYARGLGRQAVQGLTFNFGDELGLIDKQKTEEFAQEHPIASTVAGIAGGLPLFAAGPGAALARASMAGRSLLSNVGRSAGFGAGLGAVSGAGAGEGGVADRLPSAATGAAVGGVFGGAIPPVIAGAGRVASAVAPFASRIRPRTPTEPPPVHPAGAPADASFVGWQHGQPYGGLQFIDDATKPALNANEGALRIIHDWVTSAGGSIDDIERAYGRYQEALKLWGSGDAQGAMTLVEAYPPLQRLLRAAASGYREVGDDAARFLQARQTGVLPEGSDAAALRQRGIPTRERYQEPPKVTKETQAQGIGSRLGDPQATGQLGRIRDAVTRAFTVKDVDYHGFKIKPGATADDIMQAMREAADPAYAATRAAGASAKAQQALQETITPILDALEAKAKMSGADIRATLQRAVNQFRVGDKSKTYVKAIETFDEAKQALDDQIEALIRGGERNKVRMLEDFRTSLMKAIDSIKEGKLGELYAKARGIYAEGAGNRDLIEEFMDAWLKGDPAKVLARYDKLTPEQQKLARHAMIGGLDEQHIGRRLTQDATLSFDTGRTDQLLTGLGSRLKTDVGKLGDIIGAEQQMVRGTAKTVVGGSMTDRNLQDAMAMGTLEIMQSINSLKDVFSGSVSMWNAGQRFFQWAADRAFGLSADRAREVSRILLTGNPQEVRAILARLRMIGGTNRMARFNELMTQAQRAAAPGISAGAGAVAAPQQPSGPTFL